MAQDYAASLMAQAIRVTRLQANGSPVTGASASYVMSSSFISFSFTPEYEEGDEFTQKGGDGTTCISFKAPDTLKRVALEIAICNPDAEFTEIISGGSLLSGSGLTQGYAAPAIGTNALPNGVSIEVWSLAVQNGKAAAANPYYRWVFPYANMRPSGDRVIENGILANTFEGWGVGNLLWGDGPQNDWAWPAATDRPYLYARSAALPAVTQGYQTVLA